MSANMIAAAEHQAIITGSMFMILNLCVNVWGFDGTKWFQIDLHPDVGYIAVL